MSRIAVVGAGVSGIYAAHQLERDGHAVTLYEQAGYLGGHTNTHHLREGRDPVHVDSGFIVCNDVTYPLFLKFLADLGVETQPAPMSFSVHCEHTGFEYGSAGLSSLLARRRNLFDLRFHRMVRDIFRFNRESRAFTAEELRGTLGDCLQRRGYSEDFTRYYIVPMAAAIWSAPASQITAFPLDHFLRFFRNHGLLSVNGDVQWRTVTGGSYRYVEAFRARFGGRIHLDARVEGVRRTAGAVQVRRADGTVETYDEVVLACHSDQALQLLGMDASREERQVLGAIRYQANRATLHTDESVMPRRRGAWSAWNYRVGDGSERRVKVSYCMNLLQNLQSAQTYLVTLNDGGAIREEHILREIDYAHPVYDPASDRARGQWERISGVNRTHYCGAYWFSGFHEDGVRSAHRVCQNIGRTQVAA